MLIALARLCLIPLMVWVTAGLIHGLIRVSLQLGYSQSFYYAGLGFGAGLIIFSVGSQFTTAYVFGHELTHWIAAKLFRRKTAGFHVGDAQGSVRVERPNMWIVLAPYLVPIYTLIWMLVAGSARFWTDYMWLNTALYAGIGLSYAYHVVLTVLALSRPQSDLKYYGQVFSLCVIVTMNFTVMFFGLNFISDNAGNGLAILWETYQHQWRFLDALIS